ncbi:chain-length determining protein [Nitrosomonas sp.]|uniref:chain-length determining protein n=1 Tax=Nitrosomonas sp. TaxID=42353 RepID=UPI0025EF0CE8|nr:chain-length determining protein [Nitrosomonas sp.]MBE7527708.1 chain-length determining protein [Burkholderiales bacterium]MCC6916062.1 chain-length determining protein [Nitrosomonas sp.]
MTESQPNINEHGTGKSDDFSGNGKKDWFSIKLFSHLIWFTLILAVFAMAYWLVIASDRYVSEGSIIIRKTDSITAPSFDLSMLIAGAASANRADQLLLREYLLSVDMLKKLDAELDLRTHYSNENSDLLSRMWWQDMEWFHRHYLSRVSIEYDDYAGVLRIQAQAYDPETAQAVSGLLVREGERYMNQISHELAETQVNFLITQVGMAQQRYQQTRQTLLAYQNKKGLLSPQAIAESLNTLIAKLEEQRAQLKTQLASLPRTLDRNHPNLVMLNQSLAAINQQIAGEKAKLANPANSAGKALNITLEEFQRLEMEATFAQELYKAALSALEKGRIDATRMLDKVSVLQVPTFPEYPMQPRRIYNTIATLLFALMLAGILKLLEGIILDHVD